MKLPKNQYMVYFPAWLIGTGILLIGVFILSISILLLNDGHFVYTLDDPYIHLALAENMYRGHYGVNLYEASAPSSSILWPFIIAPFSFFNFASYLPLFINIVFSATTLFVIWIILSKYFYLDNIETKKTIIFLSLMFFIFSTNMIGLIFTGMEHSLQVLLVVIITAGLIIEVEEKEVRPFLLVAIVVAPLVRYENVAVSLAAVLYLFGQRYFKTAGLVLSFMILFLGAFSLFLMQLGLKPIPSSILVKSDVAGNPTIVTLIVNFVSSLYNSKGVLLAGFLLGFLFFALFSRQSWSKRLLASVASLAILLHLLSGSYGSYNRYEIYILAFVIFVVFYLSADSLSKLLTADSGRKNIIKLMGLAGLALVLASPGYVYNLVTIPIASNNIYDQHYQMHRFAVDYYKKPIGVHDLGYVSYQNDNYILDLSGLASTATVHHTGSNQGLEWINTLAEAKDVEFIMVYEDEFKDLPENWVKMGELHLSKQRVTPWNSVVAFYALNQKTYQETLGPLQAFQASLPEGVKFNIYSPCPTRLPESC